MLHITKRTQVALSKLIIKNKLKTIPSGAIMDRYFTLYGLVIVGSFFRRISTAAQIIAKANKVPILVILVAFSIGVTDAINEAIATYLESKQKCKYQQYIR